MTGAYDVKLMSLENENKALRERLGQKNKEQEADRARYTEDVAILKKELAIKTKMLMDIQRSLEKVKMGKVEMELVKANTLLNAEIRRSEDKLATMQMQMQVQPSRLPASLPSGHWSYC